jgi:hypothetical protein
MLIHIEMVLLAILSFLIIYKVDRDRHDGNK